MANRFTDLHDILCNYIQNAYSLDDGWQRRRLAKTMDYKHALIFLLREWMYANNCWKLVDAADVMKQHHTTTLASLENSEAWYYQEAEFHNLVEKLRPYIFDILYDNYKK